MYIQRVICDMIWFIYILHFTSDRIHLFISDIIHLHTSVLFVSWFIHMLHLSDRIHVYTTCYLWHDMIHLLTRHLCVKDICDIFHVYIAFHKCQNSRTYNVLFVTWFIYLQHFLKWQNSFTYNVLFVTWFIFILQFVSVKIHVHITCYLWHDSFKYYIS